MKKTSDTQMEMLLDFMERVGDIGKKNGHARGQEWLRKKWSQLMLRLNSEGSGVVHDIGGWRKVWSDLKNNTKRKYATANRILLKETGGSLKAPIITTQDMRVMEILGKVLVTGMPAVPEIDFSTEQDDGESPVRIVIEVAPEEESEPSVERTTEEFSFNDQDWTAPEPESTMALPLPQADSPFRPVPLEHAGTSAWKTPAKKRKALSSVTRTETAGRAFLEAQQRDREYERERDRRYEELEREMIRQRDVELRQRDFELQLQGRWMDFMAEALNVIKDITKQKERDE